MDILQQTLEIDLTSLQKGFVDANRYVFATFCPFCSHVAMGIQLCSGMLPDNFKLVCQLGNYPCCNKHLLHKCTMLENIMSYYGIVMTDKV